MLAFQQITWKNVAKPDPIKPNIFDTFELSNVRATTRCANEYIQKIYPWPTVR